MESFQILIFHKLEILKNQTELVKDGILVIFKNKTKQLSDHAEP